MAQQNGRAKAAAPARKTAKSATRSPSSATRAAEKAVAEGIDGLTQAAIEGAKAGIAVAAPSGLAQPASNGAPAPVSADASTDEPDKGPDVTKELSGGGVAFGEFVKSVGLAVAEAQEALDKTLRETAKALSETQIDVIAVFEQVTRDEDGKMDKGIVHNQKLPLINYVMPTAYHWSRVYLEADMNVQEFQADVGLKIQQKYFHASANASGNMFGFNASGGFSAGVSDTSVNTSVSTDQAVGSLHMEATLEPRSDIQLPKPFILQKGPALDLKIGSKTEMKDPNDATKAIGYKVELTAVLRMSTGDPNPNKDLATTISDPTLTFEAAGKTDSNGEMKITVVRRILDPANDKPTQAMVRVSFGLVNQAVGIAI